VGTALKWRNGPFDHGSPAWLAAEAASTLLVPLCDAQDALARLDARAAAASAPVREGLCASGRLRLLWRGLPRRNPGGRNTPR
jgi:hypothetical protein